jgi:hypothetical protein
MVSPKLLAPNDLAACLMVRGLNLTCLLGYFSLQWYEGQGFVKNMLPLKVARLQKG